MTTISRKKPFFTISTGLRKYLREFGRSHKLPLKYKDLLYFDNSFPLYTPDGVDTLWHTVTFPQSQQQEIHTGLTMIYAILKADGVISVMEHLTVDRIDYCTFGNSKPFRIRIINRLNDNYDHFYIKVADASRVYGLELEHILSPNRINFLVGGDTLIEEHIAGVPGDQFVLTYLEVKGINKVRIAKEFIKFNERCLVRLLGDMRSYNFVIDITPDFEEIQYRIKAIDFDQQSYEGKRRIYLPQLFKENLPFVELCIRFMTNETVAQYQQEERSMIASRMKSARNQLKSLMDCMVVDELSTKEKIVQLREELANHYEEPGFLKCNTMGELVRKSLSILVRKSPNKLKFPRQEKKK